MARTATTALAHARDLLKRHILIDGHNDLPWEIRNAEAHAGDIAAYDLRRRTPGHTDLPRLRRGGVGGQFWSVFVPGQRGGAGFARTQLEQLDLARRMIARYPRDLAPCWSSREVRAAFAAGRIASLLGMEGGHVLENSMGALRGFHELGARYLTLTHNQTTDWADSATDEPRHGGLSPFGREVVGEMNRLGMLVDLSHVAPSTMGDALDVTEAPVIFSHSSARALCDVPRNVPDEILARIPANGGVVMVTFVAGFVSPAAAALLVPAIAEVERRLVGVTDAAERRAISREVVDTLDVPIPPITVVADHVEHAARVAGVEHVGLGGDFDGSTFQTDGLRDVSGYPNLFAELIDRGWTDGDLARLAGENVLRVMREAEAVASRLRRTGRQPSLATIGSGSIGSVG
ncbi:MAG: dipeptidase [Chloroflexota bacterium]|nr:dipeptidase [Chloroflexota bacterium]